MRMKKLIFIILVILFTGCKSHKAVIQEPAPPITLNNSDSVRIRTVIKTIYVPVEVEAPIPQQSETNVSRDDSSHVETDMAFSDAWVKDGILHHSIKNKDGTIKANAYVPQTTEEKETENASVREIPVPQPYRIEVEKELTWWESFRLGSFWYLMCVIVVLLFWVFRKQILQLMT